MADRAQSGQRNIYCETEYKVDNRKKYHEDYIQSLSYCPSDFPVQAQRSGKSTVAAKRSPHLGRKDCYGYQMDCGEKVERLYNSLYPGDLLHTHGSTRSFKSTCANQVPRLRPPPSNMDLKIPSKFVPDPNATFEQTRTAAFGDTSKSFGPSVMPLACSPHHFTVPKPLYGQRLPGSTHYIPARGTSEAIHLPTSPGTRRNLTQASSQHEERGNEAMHNKNFPAAIKAYTAALKTDPRNPTLFRNRAAGLAQVGKFPEAARDCEQVCRLMPNNRKGMIRHKAVVDFMERYSKCAPGSAEGNLTVAHLLMPEEFTAHNYTTRLTTQWDTRPVPIPTSVDPRPPTFYEQGSPAHEPLSVAKKKGSRSFWETQPTNPEARSRHNGKYKGVPGSNFSVDPMATTTQFPGH